MEFCIEYINGTFHIIVVQEKSFLADFLKTANKILSSLIP